MMHVENSSELASPLDCILFSKVIKNSLESYQVSMEKPISVSMLLAASILGRFKEILVVFSMTLDGRKAAKTRNRYKQPQIYQKHVLQPILPRWTGRGGRRPR